MTDNGQVEDRACSVACTLPSEEQTARLGELMNGLLAEVLEVSALPSGYALDFPDNTETRREIDEFIAFEQQCCSFMTYEVTSCGPQQIRLTLTGPEGTKAFLSKWLGEIERSRAANESGSTMKRAGFVGAAAAVLGALCCATPALAAAMAALGLAGATGTVAIAIDTAAPLLLAGSVGLFFIGRRRQRQAAETGVKSDACGC
jgi:hypothetical protein